jgi:hypothetical protein
LIADNRRYAPVKFSAPGVVIGGDTQKPLAMVVIGRH